MTQSEKRYSKPDAAALDFFRETLARVGPLSDAAWKDARPRFTEYRMRTDEYFLAAGELAQYSGFVVSGTLREFFITPDGQEFNKNFILEGGFTGSLYDLLTREPSTASIQALTPAQLLVCHFTDLQILYERHKEWEHIGRLLAENLFMLKARREWEFMTLDAEQRYLRLMARRPELEARVSQYHLASHLGISAVSLSRIRRRLGRPKLR